MSISDRIPKQIEDVLVTHRRGFLKSAGLLAVSFGASAAASRRRMRRAAPRLRDQARIPIPISGKSTRGS